MSNFFINNLVFRDRNCDRIDFVEESFLPSFHIIKRGYILLNVHNINSVNINNSNINLDCNKNG